MCSRQREQSAANRNEGYRIKAGRTATARITCPRPRPWPLPGRRKQPGTSRKSRSVSSLKPQFRLATTRGSTEGPRLSHDADAPIDRSGRAGVSVGRRSSVPIGANEEAVVATRHGALSWCLTGCPFALISISLPAFRGSGSSRCSPNACVHSPLGGTRSLKHAADGACRLTPTGGVCWGRCRTRTPLGGAERRCSAGTDDEAGHADLNETRTRPRGAVGAEVGEAGAEEHLRAERLRRRDFDLRGRKQRRQGATSVRRGGMSGGRRHESADLNGPGVRRLNRDEPRCGRLAPRDLCSRHGPGGLGLVEERAGDVRRWRCNGLWRRRRCRRARLIGIIGGIRITAAGRCV